MVFKGIHWSKMPNREQIIKRISSTQRGKHISPKTEFKRANIPWNKDKKGVMPTPWNKGKKMGFTPRGAFKKGCKALNPFPKGNKPWNKGMVWNEMRGKNHPNWKGGQPHERDLLKGRIEYVLWRTAVFTRDKYTCQFCGERGVKLNADHIKPWRDFPELRYAIDNGRTLCVECHRLTNTYGNRRYLILDEASGR